MYLAPEHFYDALDAEGIIDKRFPLWWSLGFEDRRYVDPQEFFGDLHEFDGSEGFKFQLGPDDENIRFTIINYECNRTGFPMFITIKPLDQAHIDTWILDNPGLPGMQYGLSLSDCRTQSIIAENYPHIRGIGLYMDDHELFWYPTLNGLDGHRIESDGIELHDHTYFTEPRSFFSRLIGYHLQGMKNTYHVIDYRDDDYKVPDLAFVPFFEFSNGKDEMMIVPVRLDEGPGLPLLIMGRGWEAPLIRGFSDSELIYRAQNKIKTKLHDKVLDRYGMDCAVC